MRMLAVLFLCPLFLPGLLGQAPFQTPGQAPFQTPGQAPGQTPGETLLRELRAGALDATECYRVRELTLARDEAQIYFTEGWLIFGKPVGGTRAIAVFSADVEGGDAELLLLPPNRGERKTLGARTGTPNLDEHFTVALLIFGSDTYRELSEQVSAGPANKKSAGMGLLLADKWAGAMKGFSGSFGLRAAADMLSPGEKRKGYVAAVLQGRNLGTFDLIFDPRTQENMLLGAQAEHGFEVWTSFTSRSYRGRAFQPEFQIRDYRIESTIDPDLTMHCVTRLNITIPDGEEGALPFEISSRMKVTGALLDGAPVEFLTPDPGIDNSLFLLVPKAAATAGRHTVEIRHEGRVIADAGNHVYSVAARGSWYPSRGPQFSKFDLTFQYPATLDLVASGRPGTTVTEADRRTTRFQADTPIRLAGFNVGNYDRTTVRREGLTIEVCANKEAERALQPRIADLILSVPGQFPRMGRRSTSDAPPDVAALPPNSTARLAGLAGELGEVINFYSTRFGPLPLTNIEVTPVPGRFGQGFPGMIYLSTLAYLRPTDQVISSMNERQQIFFSDLLHAHEAAHQWWGNVVTSAGYHDDWIMEALANYSSLLFLEKRKGVKALDLVLEDYRKKLLERSASGKTVESTGPVVEGVRLEDAWVPVVYGKGTWIIHMLRRRLGDEAFARMMSGLRRDFEDKTLTTDQFREFCAKFLPAKSADPKLETFFDQWVYGTGIPALKLAQSSKAGVVSGTVTANGTNDDFSGDIPVDIQTASAKRTILVPVSASDPGAFEVKITGVVRRVGLDLTSVLHQ